MSESTKTLPAGMITGSTIVSKVPESFSAKPPMVDKSTPVASKVPKDFVAKKPFSQ